MAIDFPASPNANDTFTVGSITYKWDGTKWIGLGVTPADRLVEGSNSLEITAGTAWKDYLPSAATSAMVTMTDLCIIVDSVRH